MIGQLHHVEIYVSDLAKTRKFWDWFLAKMGYELFQEWPDGVSWKLGVTYLVFVQAEPDYISPAYHRKRPGLNHLAFHGGSKDDVRRLRDEILAHGATELYADRFPHASGPDYFAFYFEDPDRMKVELVAEAED